MASFLPYRASLGLLIIFMVCGVATGAAQAPGIGATPESLELPRFTLRQMLIGRNDSVLRIPGPWLRAAMATAPESVAAREYRTAASRIGIEPLQPNALLAERSQHVMGLYRRRELLRASQRTLEAIRAAIPSDTTRARFDWIFRPRGEWVVDLHDAALGWARSRAPDITWEAARAALAAAHWAPASDTVDQEALPRALYGLAVLAASDSAAFAAAKAALVRADSASAAAVLLLLDGYTEGRRWYADALIFFLREPWVPGGAGRSIRDYVRAGWRPVFQHQFDPPLPQIEPRWFGYPQAVPRYGVPPALFADLVHADNASAREWLQKNGESGLLRSLRWLPSGDTTPALLRTATETLRLTTVSRHSQESLNGFLEPGDAIAIDPGYSPLLALGAVVHEWQHLLFRRRQLEEFARTIGGKGRPMVQLPGVQPHLAEGFAEWSSERILAPVVERWPLLGLGELEKRADLAQRAADDQHTIGYALVRALASVLSDPTGITELLLRHAENPSGVVMEPAIRNAWRKYRSAPDRNLRAPALRRLVPEVTFSIEDGFPDVIATRIHVPVDQ